MTTEHVVDTIYVVAPLPWGLNRATGDVVPRHAVEGRYELMRIDVLESGQDRHSGVVACGSRDAMMAARRLMERP